MNKKKIIIFCLVFIFVILSILIKIKGIFQIDTIIYKFIISFRTENLTNFFKLFTRLGTFNVCLGIGLIVFLIFRNKTYIVVPISIVLIKIINLFTKFIINRDRPNILRLVTEKESSFPSGHATMAITLYGLLIYFIWKKCRNPRLKTIIISMLLFLILLIGISRIYLGVHYFTDIIGGYILGLIYLLIVTNYLKG